MKYPPTYMAKMVVATLAMLLVVTACGDDEVDLPDKSSSVGGGGGSGGAGGTPDCGNGLFDDTESCDDGNTMGGDGCGADCQVELGYECVGAPSECSIACGDGVVGDGVITDDKQCDDGNTDSGDGCSATCQQEDGWTCAGQPSVCTLDGFCGDGEINAAAGEQCDDGNTVPGDGCDENCQSELCKAIPPYCNMGFVCDFSEMPDPLCEQVDTCGNNQLEDGEGCDDGGLAENDECSADCKIDNGNACNTETPGLMGDASCASGICDETEDIDTCEPVNTCGNGDLEGTYTLPDGTEFTEECDDGDNSDSGFCLTDCKKPSGCLTDGDCGTNEVCNTKQGTPGICQPASECGNGRSGEIYEVDGEMFTEFCDVGDADDDDGDGCNSDCRREDGQLCTDSEECTGVCDSNEMLPVCESENTCGNGVPEEPEICDDGNIDNDDACNSTCTQRGIGQPCVDSSECTGVCDSNEMSPVCELAGIPGNGTLDPMEGCDDGNVVPGDGCNETGLIEDDRPCNADPDGETGDASCANGICDETEDTPMCEPVNECGNSVLESVNGEACDDGNTDSDAACDSNCQIPLQGVYYWQVNRSIEVLTANNGALDGPVSLSPPIPGAAIKDLALSPDGMKLAVSDGSNIKFYNTDGSIIDENMDGAADTVASGGSSISQVSWSANGDKLAYLSGDAVYFVNADGSDADMPHRVSPEGQEAYQPAWSPVDKNHLFFIGRFAPLDPADQDGYNVMNLWVVDTNAEALVPMQLMTAKNGEENVPGPTSTYGIDERYEVQFDANGKAYYHGKWKVRTNGLTGRKSIYRVDVAGFLYEEVPGTDINGASDDRHHGFRVSPDGTKLAFSAIDNSPGNSSPSQVYVVDIASDLNTEPAVQVSAFVVTGYGPTDNLVWHPDGDKLVAYGSWETGKLHVFLLPHLDGVFPEETPLGAIQITSVQGRSFSVSFGFSKDWLYISRPNISATKVELFATNDFVTEKQDLVSYDNGVQGGGFALEIFPHH